MLNWYYCLFVSVHYFCHHLNAQILVFLHSFTTFLNISFSSLTCRFVGNFVIFNLFPTFWKLFLPFINSCMWLCIIIEHLLILKISICKLLISQEIWGWYTTWFLVQLWSHHYYGMMSSLTKPQQQTKADRRSNIFHYQPPHVASSNTVCVKLFNRHTS